MNGTDQIFYKKPESHRFLLLDALRGLAAVVVVFWHAAWFGFYRWIHAGYLAVDFFFCLSGFVIAFSYESRLRGQLALLEFCKARVLRLYPVYILGSIFGLLVGLSLFRGAPRLQLERIYVSLFFHAFLMWPIMNRQMDAFLFPLDIPAWSLFYELWVNVFFAVAIRARLLNNAILVSTILTAATFLAHNIVRHGGIDFGSGNAAGECSRAFLRTLLSFLLGVVSCRLYRMWHVVRRAPWIDMILAIAILLLLIVLLTGPGSLLRPLLTQFLSALLLFPTIIYLGATVHVPHRFTAMCVALGEISYPLYLLHMPVLTLLTSKHLRSFFILHPTRARWLFSLVVALLALASWLVAKFIDLPLRRTLLKSSLFRRPQANAA